MNSFEGLIASVTQKYHDQIKRSCNSLLSYFNLNDFWYYRIGQDGRFGLLNCNLPFLELYGAQRLYALDPYFRNPRFFQTGTALLQDQGRNSILGKFNSLTKEKLNRRLSFLLIEKIAGQLNVFGFSSQSSDSAIASLLIHEMPLLRAFINKFKESHRLIFSKIEDNLINIADMIGPDFHVCPHSMGTKFEDRKNLLGEMGICSGSSLSGKERGILKLALTGRSAAQIALVVHLSKRTVEHHIERIKYKLGCLNRIELIEQARELEIYGFFEQECSFKVSEGLCQLI